MFFHLYCLSLMESVAADGKVPYHLQFHLSPVPYSTIIPCALTSSEAPLFHVGTILSCHWALSPLSLSTGTSFLTITALKKSLWLNNLDIIYFPSTKILQTAIPTFFTSPIGILFPGKSHHVYFVITRKWPEMTCLTHFSGTILPNIVSSGSWHLSPTQSGYLHCHSAFSAS
jgi:hypothetical protein